MNTSSSLYRELNFETIQMLVQECLAEELHEAKLLEGGLFNTTYLVVYGSLHKKAVLRVGPVNRQLLLPFEENLMQGEAYVYSLCQKHQIPCSTVLVCDTSKILIDRDFMFVDYIQSIPLSDESIPESQKTKLFQQTGGYTARLHQITNKTFGRVSEIASGLEYQSWSDFLYAEIEKIEAKSLEHHAFESNLFEHIKSIFKKHKNVLDTITVPHLVHADLWSGNILVNQVNGEYEVVAVIDADRAIFGDVEYDFATPWLVNDDFIKGYQKIPESHLIAHDENSKIKKDLYLILCHLTDAYVWKVQYHQEANYRDNLDRIMHLCNKLK